MLRKQKNEHDELVRQKQANNEHLMECYNLNIISSFTQNCVVHVNVLIDLGN